MKKLLLVSLILIVGLVIAGCEKKAGFEVNEIIDGDSFILTNGEEVRLIGINAPEIDEPGGPEAKASLAKMFANRKLRLEKDITDRDNYERLLRYVYADDIFVNAQMVKSGYAIARCFPPDERHKTELASLQKQAEEYKRGLWASGSVIQPPKASETPKGDIISWRDAASYYRQIKTVEGKIVRTHNSGKACFLNFHPDYRKTHFYVVIFPDHFHKFPASPEKLYLNKEIRVRGRIKEYNGKPQIIVDDPVQIEIVK